MDVIIKRIAEELVKCYNGNTYLRFPQYRDKTDSKRISEQESKFFFSNVLNEQKLSFSVEVPILQSHAFTGITPRSALHDMVVYKKDEESFEWVIELKSGQPKEIKKDFIKMIKSECNCVWFHTLKNSDKRTLSALGNKFEKAWKEVASEIKKEEEYEWHFAIVVLEQKQLYRTVLTAKKDEKFPTYTKWEKAWEEGIG
jgi:hypothetical protein